MSTLGEINVILDAIQKDLHAIDLTKETDVKKIQGMATKPISETDKVIARDDFEEEHLDATIAMFEEASGRVEAYDPTVEYEEAKKDWKKAKEISDRVQAKKEVKEQITGKYDELSKKKAVIEKYKEKYDPQHLVDRRERKLKDIDDKIASNDTRMNEIDDFKKSKVSGELGEIKKNLALIKELEELEDLAKKVEDREKEFQKLQTQNLDPDLLKGLEEQLNGDKQKLNQRTAEISKKYKGITLDSKDLKASISTARNNAQKSINKAKSGIESKVTGAEKKYKYTPGFETFIKEKIKNATNDRAFLEIFDKAKSQLEAENINLAQERATISKEAEEIKLGTQVRAAGPAPVGPTSTEPSEAEIQKYLEDHPELRTTLAPDLTPEDKTQRIYDSLVKDKRSQSPWLHPIAFLRSRYDKGLRENWQASYEKGMRDKAIEAIKATKQAEADKTTSAVKTSESKESAFRRALFTVVKGADAAKIEQMDKDADKAPGTVLVDVYDQMEQEEEVK